MSKPIVHWEFWSKEPSKVSDFYSKVFDWKIQHIPEMDYRMVEASGEGGLTGGIMTPKDGPWPGNMSFYIDVDSLAVYRKKIVEAGGKIIVEEMEIPGMGKLSMFQDPDERIIGIWEKLAQAGK